MSDESTPGIADDWHPPERVWQVRAWELIDPEKRERLAELQRERDEQGKKRWEERRRYERLEGESEYDGWIILELYPVDPRDTRPVEQIGQWPYKLEVDEYKRVNAIIDEHYPQD